MENTKVTGILRSVSAKTKQNVNGTLSRVCQVEIDGTVYLGKVWDSSYSLGMPLDQEYTVDMQPDGDKVWLTVLRGQDAKIATMADFAHLFVNVG